MSALRGERLDWRDTQLIQLGGRSPGPDGAYWGFRGVWTPRYSYVRRVRDGAEFLYDRARDPFEHRSMAASRSYRPVLTELRRRHDQLVTCAGETCRVDFGPVPRPR